MSWNTTGNYFGVLCNTADSLPDIISGEITPTSSKHVSKCESSVAKCKKAMTNVKRVMWYSLQQNSKTWLTFEKTRKQLHTSW